MSNQNRSQQSDNWWESEDEIKTKIRQVYIAVVSALTLTFFALQFGLV